MTDVEQPVQLSLIIPAYNEADAIQSTLRRAVEGLREIEQMGDLGRGEVILVNDGSTDQTLERARTVSGVIIVTYSSNRGYGRAIETGFAQARGSLLSFMDADGTCDPGFLKPLWQEMKQTNADIVLGSRLHAHSKMPWLRRLGNTLYAWLLSAISGKRIRDTASGMRLLRRKLLERIRPLPAGMAFTPAMSARCVLDPAVHIREIEMPYEERVGESKLNVLRDGLVFLQVILVTALFYTPLRIFGSLALLLAALGLVGGGAMPHFFAASLLSGYLGLMFHFFSKNILPTWPSSTIELLLRRLLTPPRLFAAAAGFYLVGLFWRPEDMVSRTLHPLAYLLVALNLFLAAGVFIVNQMRMWQQGAAPDKDLLAGAEVIRTPAP
jgi:glycosyltransferase involved in cell wall biosynthesis